MKDCVFCKIVRDESESWTVYEDDLVKAFLDTNPLSEGHTLIIPKEHRENIYDIPEETLMRIATVAKRLADAYTKALNTKAVNLLHASGKEAQQSVFHFHIHLVPRRANDGLLLGYPTHPKLKLDLNKTSYRIKKHVMWSRRRFC